MQSPEILYEDKDILAINKPAGIAVHADGKSDDKTIADLLVSEFPKLKKVGEPLVLSLGTEVMRPGIVHRLDKETSGVLLVAKTQAGYEHLKSQFKSREIKKTYLAFIYGRPKDERGVIDKPIGRAVGGVRKWATGSKARGELREAMTRYKVLNSTKAKPLGSKRISLGETVSLIEVWPLTGRTHQIRVHMQSIGHPVVADPIYAPSRPKLLGYKRLALHALRIVFKDLGGRSHEIVAPIPHDFEFAQTRLL